MVELLSSSTVCRKSWTGFLQQSTACAATWIQSNVPGTKPRAALTVQHNSTPNIAGRTLGPQWSCEAQAAKSQHDKVIRHVSSSLQHCSGNFSMFQGLAMSWVFTALHLAYPCTHKTLFDCLALDGALHCCLTLACLGHWIGSGLDLGPLT